jgi:hypothetical protein
MYHVEGRGEVHTGFWWGNLKKRFHLEDQGVDVKIILRWIFGKTDWGMDWIDLVQDNDRCQDPVNALMNLGVA